MKMLSRKESRRLDIALNSLFSRKGLRKPTFRPGGQFDPNALARTLTLTGGRSVELSDIGLDLLGQIASLLSESGEFGFNVDYSDIASACRDVVVSLLEQDQMPNDGGEFVELVWARLEPKVGTHYFVVSASGVALDGIDSFPLRNLAIVEPSLERLSGLGLSQHNEHVHWAVEAMGHFPWLVGAAYGTKKVARERFTLAADLGLGLISIFAAATYAQGARAFRIRAHTTPDLCPGVNVWIAWPDSTKSPVVTRNFASSQPLRLSGEDLVHWEAGPFEYALDFLQRSDRNELEEALARAVYWFSDAQRDPSLAMQFVKYWTCVEVLFSSDRERITWWVSTGMPALMVGGDVQFATPDDYRAIRKRIESLYAARSNAVHAGDTKAIGSKDVADLSRWVSWTLLNVILLARRGYADVAAVLTQVPRLHRLLSGASEPNSVVEPIAMAATADVYLAAAVRSLEDRPMPDGNVECLPTAAIVLLALSAEIGLKALVAKERGITSQQELRSVLPVVSRHQLTAWFSLLSNGSQERIKTAVDFRTAGERHYITAVSEEALSLIDEAKILEPKDFQKSLNDLSKAFETWRYSYEHLLISAPLTVALALSEGVLELLREKGGEERTAL